MFRNKILAALFARVDDLEQRNRICPGLEQDKLNEVYRAINDFLVCGQITEDDVVRLKLAKYL